MGIFNWITNNEDVSPSISAHIKQLIDIIGVTPDDFTPILTSFRDFLSSEYSRTGYGRFIVGDYLVYCYVGRKYTTTLDGNVHRYNASELYIAHSSELRKIYQGDDNEELILYIYDYLKKKEEEKIIEEKTEMDNKIQLLIMKDKEKYFGDKRFDEMKNVFEKRKRLAEITKEAIAIHNEFSLTKI